MKRRFQSRNVTSRSRNPLLAALLVMCACALLVASSMSAGCRSDSRFRRAATGAVLDTKTGLMWAEQDNGRSVDWGAAREYCTRFAAGGFKDWRLPTQAELLTLFEPNRVNRDGFRLTAMIQLTGPSVWTSEVPTGPGLEQDRPRAIYLSFAKDFPGGRPLMTYQDEKHASVLPAWPNLRALPVRGALR
jgi:hypothetical protein